MPLRLAYYSELGIRFKLEPGTFFTSEIQIDGVYQRHLNYFQAPEEWQELSIPLMGKELEAIKLSIGEPSDLNTVHEYAATIDWIKLQLTSE